jgi:hypothetical protein
MYGEIVGVVVVVRKARVVVGSYQVKAEAECDCKRSVKALARRREGERLRGKG